jgi:ankyrin repeat protein
MKPSTKKFVLNSLSSDSNLSDSLGNTALHYADYNLSKRLLEAGADVNARNHMGMSKMDIVLSHNACEQDTKELWLTLFSKYDVHHDPLVLAVLFKEFSVVEALLHQGANPNTQICAQQCGQQTGFYSDYFFLLKKFNEEEYLKSYISAGYSVSYCAVVLNRTDCLSNLLKAGADVNFCDPNTGCSLVCLATILRHVDCLQLLIAAGCDLNVFLNQTGHSPLHIATQLGYEDCVSILVKGGADVNLCSPLSGMSVLIFAVAFNRVEILKMLVQAGADVNLVHEIRHKEIRDNVIPHVVIAGVKVENSLACGGIVNGTYGWSRIPFSGIKYALQVATIYGHSSVIAILVQCGAVHHQLPELKYTWVDTTNYFSHGRTETRSFIEGSNV